MNRREFLRMVGIGAAAAGGLSSREARAADKPLFQGNDAQRPPNIVVVLWHDLGDWLGCYGRSGISSPNLDALAAQSVLFGNYFSVAPTCGPSRSSAMTGLYPHTNGVMGQLNRGFTCHLDIHPLPRLLGDAGYATHLVGVTDSTDPKWFGYQSYHKGNDDQKMDTAARIISEHGQSKQPLFLMLTTWSVHRSYPDEFDGSVGDRITLPPHLPDIPAARRDMASFAEYVHQADAQFGRVVEALDKAGMTDNTLLIFTTDHGPGIPRAKMTLYDPGLRIAMLMRWPGVLTPGRCDALLSNVDLAPTLLEWAGVQHPAPQTLDGRSFVPVLTGQTPQVRDVIFAEQSYHALYDPGRTIRTQRYKYILNFEPHVPFTVEPQAVHRYGKDVINELYSAPAAVEELYDLAEDPHEFRNVAADPHYDQIRRSLHQRLIAQMQKGDDPLLHGPVPNPDGNEISQRKHFDKVWSRDEATGLFHVDLPPDWEKES
ncbi:MAG: sulfatase [Phycisphaeraceae bacterium]|nr:sulfatase [Phycisphaeraceae bacterium]